MLSQSFGEEKKKKLTREALGAGASAARWAEDSLILLSVR